MHLHCDFQYESLVQLLAWFLPALGTCKTKLQFLRSATGWFLKFVVGLWVYEHKRSQKMLRVQQVSPLWQVCNPIHAKRRELQTGMQNDYPPVGIFFRQVPRWNTLNIIQVTSDLYKQHLFNSLWLVFSKKNIVQLCIPLWSRLILVIWQVTRSWMRFLLTQFVLRKWVCLQYSRHLAFEEEILVFLGPSTTPVPILKVHHSISLSLKQSMLQMARSRPTHNFQIDCYP